MMPVDPPATPLAPRVALASIACFWAFYCAVWSLRHALLSPGHETMMLGTRAIVSLGTAGITVVFYVIIRRVPADRLGRRIGAALALAAPAAMLYAAFNWYMFSHLGAGAPMRWNWTVSAPKIAPGPSPAAESPWAPMPVTVGAMPNAMDDAWSPLQAIADQAGNGYFFFIAWAALYLALSYAAEVGALERRAAALRVAAQAAELRALRYQVNPHFLFNTLNSLSSLVLAGSREQAEQMIMNLATFFRTSLTGDATEDVKLQEEIRLQLLYLAIEQVRFPDRLQVIVDLPEALGGACVPGLILQPLVENAVKHGVSRSPGAVTIRIVALENDGRLALSVQDDGDRIEAGTENFGTGVGLRNVQNRLAARFGDDATCSWGARDPQGFIVTLTMPLIYHAC